MSDIDLKRAVDVAKAAVEAAAEAALAHFCTDLEVERKADHSPVTIADKAAEAAIISVIRDAYPDHALLTEESGAHDTDSPFRWIVDPIDGTRGFTRGGSYWGPLIALERDGELIVGAMGMPVLDEVYWAARGMGAYCNGERLQVSEVTKWDDAIISLGELPYVLGGATAPQVYGLIETAYSARCYGDLAGCALLLKGLADVWLENGVQYWDLAPHKVLLEEAGGRFTDYAGQADATQGSAVGTNGPLHEHVLRALQSVPTK